MEEIRSSLAADTKSIDTVKLALKAGHSVRAMARSANAIRLHDPRLEKLDGDALDQHTIERALVGVNAVIQTLGVSPTPELILSGTRLFSVATRILVNAMEASAVQLPSWSLDPMSTVLIIGASRGITSLSWINETGRRTPEITSVYRTCSAVAPLIRRAFVADVPPDRCVLASPGASCPTARRSAH
jgi:hypothetical protein